MSKNATENIRRLISLLVIVVIVLSLFRAPQGFIDFVVGLFASAILGAVTSPVAAIILETLTGDALKGILIPVQIGPLEFSVSLFLIATVISQVSDIPLAWLRNSPRISRN